MSKRRRVFISFLGTNDYTPIRYYLDPENMEQYPEVRFVQETLLRHYAVELESDDKIYICTTAKAYKTNWLDYDHPKRGSEETIWREGLEKVIAKIGLSVTPETVDIPDGKEEKELWQIFDTMYDLLHEGDDVIFDITHSFRTLPILNLALINYARILKDVRLLAIHYGAFEARSQDSAPIWDLKSVVDLMDWTSAANSFIEHGSAGGIRDLVRVPNLAGLDLSKKQKNMSKNALQKFGKHLELFTQSIATNRGLDIIENQHLDKVHMAMNSLAESNPIPALSPILKKIEQRTTDFEQNSLQNGFSAVQWCIDNGLTQQGITLLQEFMVSYILEELGFDFKDRDYRRILSAVLGMREGNKFTPIARVEISHENQYRWESIFRNQELVANVKSIYERISNFRNSINHAGMTDKRDSAQFGKNLEECLKQFRTTILDHS